MKYVYFDLSLYALYIQSLAYFRPYKSAKVHENWNIEHVNRETRPSVGTRSDTRELRH